MFFSQLLIKNFSRDLVLLHEMLKQNRNIFKYSAKVLRYHGVFLSFFILLRHFAPWERIQDSLVLWTPSRVFRILRTEFQSSSVELGFRIPIVLGFEFLELFSGFLSLGFRFRIPRATISQFSESKFAFTGMTLLIIKGAEKGISVWACMFWYWQTSCFQFWSDDFWGQPLHQPFQPQFTMKGKFDFLFVQCQERIAEKLCRRGFMWAVTSKEFIHRLKS